MAFTFLAPILGGWVADKLIGYVWAVTVGGILILLGNIVLSLPLDLNAVYLGLAIVVFIITAVFFWSLYKQMFNSLALFIDKDIQRSIMGHTIPTGMFVLVPNSAFIIILASIFAKVWIVLDQKGKNPSSPAKFLMGLFFSLASFSTLALSAYLAYTTGTKSSMLWLLAGIFLLTCAELCISPVGLSIVSKMSPPRLSGF